MKNKSFINNDREFLPKEIGVTSLINGDTAHWILTPEFLFNLLSEERQLENNALTRKHGLEWYDGESMIKYVHTQLRYFCQNSMKIYTRGRAQKSYLESLLCRPVIN
ncbi:Protein of unknown function [Cotesia congregata]|uniref:Uncharacterized protein n=1 Tax=Cotesia congregata TaxID=51543 RepID=A0A8J2MRK8_COTCN|nr:Protein of unknown function [Cotesia congregata]